MQTLPVLLNQLALDCVVATGTPPPHTARLMAILHSAMYDAWAVYRPEPLPYRLHPALRRPAGEHTRENRTTAITCAAFQVLRAYFEVPLQSTNKKTLLSDAYTPFEYDPGDASFDPATPVGMGNLAAQAMLDYSGGDGSNVWKTLGGAKPYSDYTGYKPGLEHDAVPVGEEKTWWQPVAVPQPVPDPPKVQQFLVPQWGGIKPFALRNGWEFMPAQGPEPHYSPRFEEQCKEVLTISEKLSDEQKCIAEYWADGPASVTPPGHWCVLAAWVSQRDGHNTGKDIRMFFALANALMDAGIACWNIKRHYNYVRPVTAIRHLYKGKDIKAWGGPDYGKMRVMKGEEWHPFQGKYFVTPPFPEYPSGHSTFSAAAATILERFTGSDIFGHGADILPGSSKLEAGVPAHAVQLRWRTFSDAAREAGMSRLYGGIHFEDGNLDGQALGKKVGEKAWAKCQQLWKGTF